MNSTEDRTQASARRSSARSTTAGDLARAGRDAARHAQAPRVAPVVTTSSTRSTVSRTARRPTWIAPAGPALRSARSRPTWAMEGPDADEAVRAPAAPCGARPPPRSRPPGCSRVTAAACGCSGTGTSVAAGGASSRRPGGAFATICAAIASASAERAAELQRADEVAGRARVGDRRPDAHAATAAPAQAPAGGAPPGSRGRAGRRGATGPSRTSTRGGASSPRRSRATVAAASHRPRISRTCATRGRRIATIP